MSDSPVFELEGVSYAYGVDRPPVVDDITLTVRDGGLTVIMGPNGAGKSTLVRLLSGVSRPDRGRITFAGRPLAGWGRTELARRLAVVAQEAPPFVPLSTRDYVALGRNPYASAWSPLSGADHEVVENALARAGLAPLADRPLSALSGGERQRAKLARALAQEPGVLILDEPTVHLDVGHALWAFGAMRELVDESGLTVICITHDLNLASRHADRAVLLSAGRVVHEGSPGDVLEPAALTAAFDCRLVVQDLGELGVAVLPAARDGGP